MRRGFTFVEIIIVLVVLSVLATLVTPRLTNRLDHLAVDRATSEIATFYRAARFRAVTRSSRIRVEIGLDSLLAVYEGATDSVAARHTGPARHGVGLRTTQRVLRIGPTGLGWGATNTTIVLTKGAAAESLTVSRMGRMKHW
jgi:prepilin-type N-terminal cleavage/methylation domain-containing protein